MAFQPQQQPGLEGHCRRFVILALVRSELKREKRKAENPEKYRTRTGKPKKSKKPDKCTGKTEMSKSARSIDKYRKNRKVEKPDKYRKGQEKPEKSRKASKHAKSQNGENFSTF